MKITYDIHGPHGCMPEGYSDLRAAVEQFDIMVYMAAVGQTFTLVRLEDGDVAETLDTKTKEADPRNADQ